MDDSSGELIQDCHISFGVVPESGERLHRLTNPHVSSVALHIVKSVILLSPVGICVKFGQR